ncbi:hypothetical protein X975_10613, partial [Stegodyphus mimosarum]
MLPVPYRYYVFTNIQTFSGLQSCPQEYMSQHCKPIIFIYVFCNNQKGQKFL